VQKDPENRFKNSKNDISFIINELNELKRVLIASKERLIREREGQIRIVSTLNMRNAASDRTPFEKKMIFFYTD